jgi:general secretion pathway protein B
MSFILDALRKSEHERQRQGGPGLAEVAAAAPRTRTSVWAAAAVVLLIANLAAVGILMLRRGRAEDGAASAPAASVATVATPASSVATAPTRSVAPDPAPSVSAPAAPVAPPAAGQSSAVGNTPPMLQPADGSAPGARNPLADEVAGDAMLDDPVLAERASSVPSGPPAVTAYPTRPGSVVYEPLPGAGGASAAASPDLPTIDDVATGLPEMHVDLHVYAANPQERFVFVNKRKYREGETLQEGPRVEEITRDGVVLSQHGRRFILPRQ